MSIEPLLLRMAGTGTAPPETRRLLTDNGRSTEDPESRWEHARARDAYGDAPHAESPSNVFMFVSTYPKEGTTYSCLRSAQNLIGYMGDAPILVVDMNLGHPDISARVGDPEEGWGSLLEPNGGRFELRDLCLRYPLHENLWILPVGSRHRPEGTLGLVRMFPELIDRIKREFHGGMALIDAGPILESSYSLLLSRFADGVVFVIEAGRTRRQVVSLSLEQLARSRANVLGAIMNKRRLAIPNWLYRRLF